MHLKRTRGRKRRFRQDVCVCLWGGEAAGPWQFRIVRLPVCWNKKRRKKVLHRFGWNYCIFFFLCVSSYYRVWGTCVCAADRSAAKLSWGCATTVTSVCQVKAVNSIELSCRIWTTYFCISFFFFGSLIVLRSRTPRKEKSETLNTHTHTN